MKIALATIFYNNSVEELTRLVNSVPDKVIDTWIWVDGIFKYTKEQHPELPDLTEIHTMIDSMKDADHNIEHVLYLYPNATEFEKRNAYLETCEDLDIDVLIIVDTDEYFKYEPYETPEEAWTRFKKNLEFEIQKYQRHNVFGISTLDVETNTHSYCPRVWVNPGQMRYLNNSHYHYGNIIKDAKDIELFKKQGLNFIQQAQAIVKGLTLAHDHSLRSPEYQQRRKEYQQYLVKFEELVQSYRYSASEAHEIAKNSPKEEFQPT